MDQNQVLIGFDGTVDPPDQTPHLSFSQEEFQKLTAISGQNERQIYDPERITLAAYLNKEMANGQRMIAEDSGTNEFKTVDLTVDYSDMVFPPDSGQQVQMMNAHETFADGSTLVSRYAPNSNGTVAEQEVYDANGNLSRKVMYDETGRLSSAEMYDAQGNVTGYATYEYDENRRCQVKEMSGNYGNPFLVTPSTQAGRASNIDRQLNDMRMIENETDPAAKDARLKGIAPFVKAYADYITAKEQNEPSMDNSPVSRVRDYIKPVVDSIYAAAVADSAFTNNNAEPTGVDNTEKPSIETPETVFETTTPEDKIPTTSELLNKMMHLTATIGRDYESVYDEGEIELSEEGNARYRMYDVAMTYNTDVTNTIDLVNALDGNADLRSHLSEIIDNCQEAYDSGDYSRTMLNFAKAADELLDNNVGANNFRDACQSIKDSGLQASANEMARQAADPDNYVNPLDIYNATDREATQPDVPDYGDAQPNAPGHDEVPLPNTDDFSTSDEIPVLDDPDPETPPEEPSIPEEEAPPIPEPPTTSELLSKMMNLTATIGNDYMAIGGDSRIDLSEEDQARAKMYNVAMAYNTGVTNTIDLVNALDGNADLRSHLSEIIDKCQEAYDSGNYSGTMLNFAKAADELLDNNVGANDFRETCQSIKDDSLRAGADEAARKAADPDNYVDPMYVYAVVDGTYNDGKQEPEPDDPLQTYDEEQEATQQPGTPDYGDAQPDSPNYGDMSQPDEPGTLTLSPEESADVTIQKLMDLSSNIATYSDNAYNTLIDPNNPQDLTMRHVEADLYNAGHSAKTYKEVTESMMDDIKAAMLEDPSLQADLERMIEDGRYAMESGDLKGAMDALKNTAERTQTGLTENADKTNTPQSRIDYGYAKLTDRMGKYTDVMIPESSEAFRRINEDKLASYDQASYEQDTPTRLDLDDYDRTVGLGDEPDPTIPTETAPYDPAEDDYGKAANLGADPDPEVAPDETVHYGYVDIGHPDANGKVFNIGADPDPVAPDETVHYGSVDIGHHDDCGKTVNLGAEPDPETIPTETVPDDHAEGDYGKAANLGAEPDPTEYNADVPSDFEFKDGTADDPYGLNAMLEGYGNDNTPTSSTPYSDFLRDAALQHEQAVDLVNNGQPGDAARLTTEQMRELSPEVNDAIDKNNEMLDRIANGQPGSAAGYTAEQMRELSPTVSDAIDQNNALLDRIFKGEPADVAGAFNSAWNQPKPAPAPATKTLGGSTPNPYAYDPEDEIPTGGKTLAAPAAPIEAPVETAETPAPEPAPVVEAPVEAPAAPAEPAPAPAEPAAPAPEPAPAPAAPAPERVAAAEAIVPAAQDTGAEVSLDDLG